MGPAAGAGPACGSQHGRTSVSLHKGAPGAGPGPHGRHACAVRARQPQRGACAPTCPPLFCPPPLAVALHHAAPADGLLAAAAGGAASHDAGLAGVKGGRSAGSERSRALRPMMAPSACSARGRTVASLLPASSSPALAPVAPLADVTHAVANTPPDAAHGHSQGADSTATAVNAGVWA